MRRLTSLALASFLIACASSAPDEEPAAPAAAPPEPPAAPAAPQAAPAGSGTRHGAPAVRGSDYVFVWILTGSATLSEEEQQAAGAGHFANMERLAAEGSLLVAGPFGEPRSAPEHRGIFVLATDDLGEARALVATDPAIASGYFRVELDPFATEAPLPELLEMERAALADGTSGMRSYVIATSDRPEEAEAALAPLAAEGLVALSGRLGEDGGRALFVLVAETLEEAREMLAFGGAGEGLGWELSPWYGSRTVERLAER